VDVVKWPELLVKPTYAADSAGWFWHSRSCNHWADDGDVRGLTRRITGGENGLRERAALTAQALKALLG
jgi:putative chitinase